MAVTGEHSAPTSTLQETYDLLGLMAAVVLIEIPLVLVHLRARDAEDDEVEIRAADPRDAPTLAAELTAVELPLRPVVLTVGAEVLPYPPDLTWDDT